MLSHDALGYHFQIRKRQLRISRYVQVERGVRQYMTCIYHKTIIFDQKFADILVFLKISINVSQQYLDDASFHDHHDHS